MTGRPAPGPRLRELDLLRFVAAAAVMLHHYVGDISGWGVAHHRTMPVLAPIAHFGALSVDLFFLISGFVILMSGWGRGLGDFAVSRIVRIFPAYWFGASLAVLLFLATGIASLGAKPGGVGPLGAYLPNLTMLGTGVGVQPLEVVYWTLWAELHFYALIGLLVWRGLTYGRCVAFMAGWLALGVLAQETHSALLTALFIPQWAPLFIAGMGFHLIYRFGANLVLGLIIGACWALTVHYRVTVVNKELVWPVVWDAVTTGVITFLFLLMLMVATGELDLVRWRGFTVLGGLTYPLYLLHETLGRALKQWLGPYLGNWGLLGVSCAAALGSAYLVYRFVEQPAQRWMRPRLKGALAQIRGGRTTPSGDPPVTSRPERRRVDGPSARPAEVAR
ncbi:MULTISPECIES: acyltransferase family protein [Thermomonosporaceae]|uniref:acyltransferase family protein n=1 Tax=Thermomonosporaceae TaxID=2012 RepID=UPI00255A8F25|nr:MULTISPECIES: acyltransferase [Thermomonosporaceae]MDL4772833.1 acyltransferase [Actinomadura xylanilytica]